MLLASTVDPAVADAAALAQAATTAKETAMQAFKSLTPALILPTAKTRQKRPVAAELEAA